MQVPISSIVQPHCGQKRNQRQYSTVSTFWNMKQRSRISGFQINHHDLPDKQLLSPYTCVEIVGRLRSPLGLYIHCYE